MTNSFHSPTAMRLLSFIKARTFLTLLFTLFLSACTTLPEVSDQPVDWVNHQEKLETLQNYALTGKMAYIGKDRRQSLNFYWKKSPDSEELRLTTLLGQTALLLTVDQTGATVVNHEGETFRHVSSNILVHRLTGLSIPVDQLSEWVKGSPFGADYYELNESNTLSVLSKQINGQPWDMTFNRYTEESGYVLPSSLTLKQDQTKIKIAVSKWIVSQ
ncbi:lipoprotein insertase outer membrane protein LolB [Vibrio nigripulchritudo]|uniref:lipoprotein insertase outer membrane protein LolB n=1 Tax=Vibrio nigripulchritudo TaxID=28173 RepID=UPI0003B1B7F0|nr:lipoprotein insertase outer membrane protein LolB [Vibrio nigripulchritudo]CCN69859.1 putative Outer-membrane lipoprotein lolB [Vibrio nigripulchritudo SFn118]